MDKVVNVNLNEGMDSMVRVLNYLRRKEINIRAIDMKRVYEDDILVKISFDESLEDEKILSHLEKLYDVKKVEII
ncbi:MAG: hypothetical protein RR515_03355 [Clostridium sp.]